MISSGIKICGLRREIDAEYINEFNEIKYVGFVFAKSKRQITPEKAKKIKCLLRNDIKTVGVFADMPVEKVIQIAKISDIDIIQLHSTEDFKYISQIKNLLSKEVWKSISVKDENSLKIAKDLVSIVDGFLLDTYNKDLRGGTGETFTWNIASDFSKKYFTVLAGGINQDNINDAYNVVKPMVIDLSSSVETNGFKDYEKIKNLIRRIN